MNILVVGSGGREHALAWKLAEPDTVERVYVAPGNAGTALEPKLANVPLDPMDIEGLVEFALEQDCALTVIGPEAPLVAGIVDLFAEHKLPCFGLACATHCPKRYAYRLCPRSPPTPQ